MLPGASRCVDVATREHRAEVVGTDSSAERTCDPWSRLAGCAAAHRIHNNHRRPAAVDGFVHGRGRAQFLESNSGELLAHRRQETLGIGLGDHPLIITAEVLPFPG